MESKFNYRQVKKQVLEELKSKSYIKPFDFDFIKAFLDSARGAMLNGFLTIYTNDGDGTDTLIYGNCGRDARGRLVLDLFKKYSGATGAVFQVVDGDISQFVNFKG